MLTENEVLNSVVLVVDDDGSVRGLISAWLQRAGYRVLEAASGLEAINVFSARSDIALLMTDISMPEMDGFALVKWARQGHPDLPVVYLTGYCEAPENTVRGSVWMSKPLHLEQFLHVVRELLARPVAISK